MMLRAVTNRDSPMLRRALKSLFNMEVDFDPSLGLEGRGVVRRFIHTHFSRDPGGRIRIIFIDAEDLSFGLAGKADVTGRSIPYMRLVLVGVPKKKIKLSGSCRRPGSMEGYLLAITMHEMYEVLTGDFDHCNNPDRCINSWCNVYDAGTCSTCMGALIDEKFPDITLGDLYCGEHLANLEAALKKWDGKE